MMTSINSVKHVTGLLVTIACSILGSQANDCQPGEYLDNVTITCQTCDFGSYNPEPSSRESCFLCPQTMDGYARTTLFKGATNQSDCFSQPIIENISPDYGPVSGGTEVIITLRYWERYDVVWVSLVRGTCKVKSQSKENSTLVCISGAVDEPVTGSVYTTFNNDKMEVSKEAEFQYRPDPTVYGVDDLKTIVSGGLVVKVFGNNFTSVARPYFTVTRIHRGTPRVFYEICDIINDNLLHCKTPNVGDGLVHHLFNLNPANSQSRTKRDVSPPTFNDDDNQFYAGLRFDGVDKYENLTQSFEHYGQLLVYPDPVFFPFTEEGQVRKFNAKENEFLDIQGQFITYACTEEDILITVGMVNKCNITFLATNLVTCQPPKTKPEIGDTGHGVDRSPRVVVLVGNLIYMIGYLDYTTDPIVTEVMIGVIVGCAVVLIFLLCLILLFIVLCRRRHHKRFKDLQGSTKSEVNNIHQVNGKKRYVENGPVLVSTVVYKHVIAGDGVSDKGEQDPQNIGQDRSREMSMTISPPGTPGEWSQNGTSDMYFNYSNRDSGESHQQQQQQNEDDILGQLEESLMLNVKECLFDSDSLEIADVIGVGYFGKVHKGFLKKSLGSNELNEIVAVKTIQGNHFTTKEVGSFLEEAVLMKEFNHKNVLSLLGVVIKNKRPFVVLPLMEYGDLKSYIRDPLKNIKVKELLSFGLQAACGMSYLAKQKFVHRDLATRNCMLNTDMVVKIADFGLSRDVYNCDYYRVEDKHKALPVRWMAVESLTFGVFSAKSDVWSFGVVLWELLTRGCSPYPDVDTFNIKAYVTSGRRLSQPTHAPDEVFKVMQKCWLDDPDARPSFDELYHEIDDILTEDSRANKPDYAKLILV